MPREATRKAKLTTEPPAMPLKAAPTATAPPQATQASGSPQDDSIENKALTKVHHFTAQFAQREIYFKVPTFLCGDNPATIG